MDKFDCCIHCQIHTKKSLISIKSYKRSLHQIHLLFSGKLDQQVLQLVSFSSLNCLLIWETSFSHCNMLNIICSLIKSNIFGKITKRVLNKRQRISKGQSKMDNPEKLKYFNKTHMFREISNQSK